MLKQAHGTNKQTCASLKMEARDWAGNLHMQNFKIVELTMGKFQEAS